MQAPRPRRSIQVSRTTCFNQTDTDPRSSSLRFCSDTCGVHYALNRLKTNKIEPAQIIESLATVVQPEGVVLTVESKVDRKHMQTEGATAGEDIQATVESESDASKPFLDRTAPARQANALENLETRRIFEQRKKKIESAIQQLSHQDSILQLAITNAESLPELTAGDGEEHLEDDELAAAKAKKSKKKNSKRTSTAAEKAAEARPCGFDMRLVEEDGAILENGSGSSDNVTMQNGDETVRPSSICLLPRKKCERHSGYA